MTEENVNTPDKPLVKHTGRAKLAERAKMLGYELIAINCPVDNGFAKHSCKLLKAFSLLSIHKPFQPLNSKK